MRQAVREKIERLIDREGGAVDDKVDRGGRTKYGITQSTAKAFGFKGDVFDLTYDQAVSIYYQRFYVNPKFYRIEQAFSSRLAEAMFDFGVHSGTVRPVKVLQRILNAFNYEERYYDDLTADGLYGNITEGAMTAYIEKRGRKGLDVLIYVFNALRTAFLFDIAESDESQERFIYGWVTRVHEIEEELGAK